ncbi:MAG: YibE/F family protein [Dehalococcoidia bacterium]
MLLAIVGGVLPALEVWPTRPESFVTRQLLEGRLISVVARDRAGDAVTERLAVDFEDRRIEVDRLYQVGSAGAFDIQPGERVLFYETRAPNGTSYQFGDRGRGPQLLLVVAVFAVSVVIVGGWQGVWSIFGLASTVLVIGRFILPAILGGASPVPVAIAGAIVIMAATLTLGHGAGRKTAIAFVATSAALILAGLLATWAVDIATLSGLAGDDEATLLRFASGVDMRGLLLAGIILGAVGVLDDVTTTQASTVIELREADPTLGRRELFRRAMRVGRDHIAATTNTLLLAYAGTALPLMVFFLDRGFSPVLVASFEPLATEVVRAAAGSIAIVAAVPLSSAVAALLVARSPRDA